MMGWNQSMLRKVILPLVSLLWPGAPMVLGQHGPGGGGGADLQKDRAVYQALLSQGDAIEREVLLRPDGVETRTESDQPDIAALIKEHVSAMKARVEEVRPIRMRDPLFAAIFENAQAISMEIQETPRGVRVIETSTHPYVVKLIQEHAKVVSNFVRYGHAEARKNHELPAP